MLCCAIIAAMCTINSVPKCALLTVPKMRTLNLSVGVVKHTAICSAPVTPVPVLSWIVVLVAELPVTALFDAPMERKVRFIVGVVADPVAMARANSLSATRRRAIDAPALRFNRTCFSMRAVT